MPVLSTILNPFEDSQAVFTSPHAETFQPAGLPHPNPSKSFWIDSSPDANPLAREGSEGALTLDADVCIIGSGMTGVSAAYTLSKQTPGLKVVILEARNFCAGATGRNGGHLTPALVEGFTSTLQKYGTEQTLKSYALENYTATEIVKVIREHGLEDAVDLVEGGHITLLITDKEVEVAQAEIAAAERAGQDLSGLVWIDAEEMEKTYGASYPGIRIPAHNLWPLKFVTQLYHLAAQNLNLTLHTRTPVNAVTPLSSEDGNDRRWSLSTPRGAVACNYVLHATNAYASHLLPHLAGPAGIVPTRAQVAALRAAVPLSELGTVSWDGNEGFEYWFPRPVKEQATHPLAIVGGGREATAPTFETGVEDDSVTNPAIGRVLRDFLPEVFPGKYEEGREFEMEWTGIMGFTKLGVPFVGVVSLVRYAREGQYISAGYTGHGMPKAYACAEVVASMIAADIKNETWQQPSWLPDRYLTWKRDGLTRL
ncbi:FAD dependent oxidoreductase [Schizophyllum commune H4-8]|uniref:FAD dependent oxidoreductase domain-containing protein n=1 Tax=Schizophyllum commune (strain H4-8 / FGSC 9210) TaxID=578458 RepID=D8QF64_SCHCM|nr:FAD dependent oxidoreductase [Schizophyllum commune H4-8]KAI5887510.1 FAD dependent oxidoreductase [Schizophyllum commune H4-8]